MTCFICLENVHIQAAWTIHHILMSVDPPVVIMDQARIDMLAPHTETHNQLKQNQM